MPNNGTERRNTQGGNTDSNYMTFTDENGSTHVKKASKKKGKKKPRNTAPGPQDLNSQL